MEMHQIRYFLAVARTLNFTRAAEECFVAQPSLTRAIKNLEAELGGELFRRERANSHLTNLGKSMLPMLAQCHESAIAAKSYAVAVNSGENSVIRIALSQTTDIDLVAKSLGELERATKGVQLSCKRGNSAEILENLRSGETELAIAGPIDQSWERLNSSPLFAEEFCVFVNKHHPFAKMNSVEPRKLKGERMIARPFCELWDHFVTLFEENDVDVTHGIEVTCDRDAIRLIEAGLGIGLLPSSTRAGDDLRKIVLTKQVKRTIQLYLVSGRERSPALSAFMNLLRSADWVQIANL